MQKLKLKYDLEKESLKNIKKGLTADLYSIRNGAKYLSLDGLQN